MALPDYLKDTAQDFATQLTAATSAPIDVTKFTGRSFIAGEDPLQADAISRATAGIGSYQPFLEQAQRLAGPGAGAGVGSIGEFMSPYQQGVIDETLRQYDISRQGGLQNIADQAQQFGAFGGGRQGALEGQFMAETSAGRAGLANQLLQQGFADAASRRAQALQNQFALSNFQRSGLAGDVASLGSLGDSLSGRLSEKYGVSFDPETGMFVGEDEEAVARANKMTKMMRAKYTFRQKQIQQQEFNKKIAEQQEAAKRADIQRIQSKLDSGGFDSTSNIPDRDRGSVTTESAAKTSKVGGGGYTKSDSAREDRRGGQYGFMDGGIVDMLEIYD